MIKSLTLINFKTYEDNKLEFASPGINIITGDTGQGKTNILLGVNWVVDNRPLGANCIRRGQVDGFVSMEVGGDGDVYNIARIRGVSENSYTVEKNGEAKSDPLTGFGNRPPSIVSEILNLSDLNVQKQRDQHFLVYTPSGQIATYIRSITKLDEIDRITKSLSSKIRIEKVEVVSKQQELKTINKKLVALGDINLPLLESKIEDTKIYIAKVKRLRAEVEQLNTIVNALRVLEKCQIHIPDNIDQVFDGVQQYYKNITEVTTCISNLKPLIDKIKRIEVYGITLPESLEVLSTVEGTLEQYNNIDKELETLVHFIDDIQIVESKITISNVQLKQLEFEEVELKEKLENCPLCGAELTEESKRILLEN